MIGSDPIPFPDDESYIRAIRGIFTVEEAREHLHVLPSQPGWFALGLDLNPVTLAVIAAYEPFANWYALRFPDLANIVAEIRSMPEDEAFQEIRSGRWLRSSNN